MHLELSDKDKEELEVVFSGIDCMASGQDFIDQHWKNAVRLIQAGYNIRHSFAVSGAMRWPWSQEAPMRADFFIGGP